MKISGKPIFKWGVPLLFILVIGLFRWIPTWAEWYAITCYPWVSGGLSLFSSCFPFSVGDCFIVAACLWVIGYPFYARRMKRGFRNILGTEVRFILWIYIWFYFAWGLNYFRLSFYERTGFTKVEYLPEEFRHFLHSYIAGLKLNFSSVSEDQNELLQLSDPDWYNGQFSVPAEVYGGYLKLFDRYGLVCPGPAMVPKWMLWSGGMSRMGVSGYMGPFFSEFNLNRELLNVEYPFTYAHEMAHRLGIAGEAEANLYAFLVTTGASAPEIRFSGYFSLLGYVMNNARRLLTEEEYKDLFREIPAEVMEMYKKHLMYWRGKYNPAMGKVQHRVYNAYLKGNKVNTGIKNYSEVVGLLMALRKNGTQDYFIL